MLFGKMWVIEDVDDDGHCGITVLMARTQWQAMEKFFARSPKLGISSIERCEWISLAELDDEQGRTGYRRRSA